MNKYEPIDISVIIPVYNVEDYLPICLESLMSQGDLRLEIILVDDGSTDQSGKIADKYAQNDDRFKVIHQENKGASAARNSGLSTAEGEYIVFLDSDDWIKEGSLSALYNEAVTHDADIVMGNIWLSHQDGSIDEPLKQISEEVPTCTLSGKEGFVWLVSRFLYLPMVYTYIYNKTYLQKIHARFEEGIIHEDELWTPIVLYQAEKMVITNIDFYYYRQNEESVMHTTNLFHRLDSLFRVTNLLKEFADRFDHSEENEEIKNWWIVNLFKLYSITFTLLSRVKNSSYIVPKYHLEYFWRNCCQMIPDSLQICRYFYHKAETGLKKYTDWRMSDWVASIDYQVEKLILIYNTRNNEDSFLRIEDVPVGCVITTDRRYFQQANLVVFHLPSLHQELENDLTKQEGQIWANWYIESEENDSKINDSEINELFDITIIYRQEENPIISLCEMCMTKEE